jgi:hypothetical protein
MAPDLPEDILHLLCAELSNRQDFPTLFNCCSTNKTFAVSAVTALYRYVLTLLRCMDSAKGKAELNMELQLEQMHRTITFHLLNNIKVKY